MLVWRIKVGLTKVLMSYPLIAVTSAPVSSLNEVSFPLRRIVDTHIRSCLQGVSWSRKAMSDSASIESVESSIDAAVVFEKHIDS